MYWVRNFEMGCGMVPGKGKRLYASKAVDLVISMGGQIRFKGLTLCGSGRIIGKWRYNRPDRSRNVTNSGLSLPRS